MEETKQHCNTTKLPRSERSSQNSQLKIASRVLSETYIFVDSDNGDEDTRSTMRCIGNHSRSNRQSRKSTS